MVKRSERWHTRSPISRFAHVVERTGLALTGGSCGLFVAAHIARSDFNLISSGGEILGMMIYGAAGFYLGIDLPPPAEKLRELPLRRLGSRADAVELLSAGGTFLTAIAAVIAVASIIADEVARSPGAVAILLAWAIGASMQIIAGITARLRAEAAE
jgi:heme A synthase